MRRTPENQGHGHAHAHSHAPAAGRAFLVGIALNLGFALLEAVFGLVARSMALLADAGHNMSDVLGLALAYGAALLARRAATGKRTYGMRGTTILAALGNALVLLFVTGGLAWESVRRFADPPEVAGRTVVFVAVAGVVVNGASALLFLRGRKRDLNVRGAFLHLASDAAVSFGVALSGVAMIATGWRRLDPAVSLVLAVVIVGSAWSLLKQSVHLAIQGVPEHIDLEAVRAYLAALPNVSEIHDLHVWAMSTTESALTAHLVVPVHTCSPGFLHEIAEELHEKFGIEHSTIQLEPPGAPHPCVLAAPSRI